MARQQLRVYPGSNEAHDFWESSDGALILLRNHGAPTWSARHNGRMVEDRKAQKRWLSKKRGPVTICLSAPTVERLLKLLRTEAGLHVTLDTSLAWQKNGKLGHSAQLPAHARKP
jgi:hypothetical protein